jgi:intracellular multiplication protein IcmV
MGALQVIKKGVVAGWNFSAWLGVKTIKQNTSVIKDLSKAAFVPGKTQNRGPEKETFAEAMRRLNLTEASLQKRIKASTQIIYLCGGLMLPMFGYTIYMFMSGFYLSTFVCLMLTALSGAYSFREHFNRFQMRQRRLGCTLSEWAVATFRLNSSRKK